MSNTDMICALGALALLLLLLIVVRWRLANDQAVIGSTINHDEFEARWADVEHAAGRAFTGSIAETHLGRSTKPARADRGHFNTGNQPVNTGSSKQIERLHLAGVPHASAVAMIEADCTMQERRVIHMREHGDSLALIAARLGVSVAKVRRLEVKAVNKIISARKEP